MSKIFSNPPDPDHTIRVARSLGKYDLAAALADLADNSIYAGAKSVEIDCHWHDGAPELRIRDDGCGMDEKTLKNAMRLACKNPDDVRDPSDLGRFGMGMKTASISQAQCLTVVSSDGRKVSAFRWDIETMKGWDMEQLNADEIREISCISKSQSGTEVIWGKIDRLPDDEDDFNSVVCEAMDTLALIFHRFIAPESPRGRRLAINFNGHPLQSVDPFCRDNPATEKLPSEKMPLGKEKIKMTAYILPHYDKLGENEYQKLAGEEGYLKNQGFYVYRNRRLIVYGTWFKLAKHGDMSRLARVMVDVPNTLDDIWRINLDKTDIQLPIVLQSRLKQLISKIRGESVRIYRNRGSSVGRSRNVTPVWERRATRQRIHYEINQQHPAIAQLLDSVEGASPQDVRNVLYIIERGLPVDYFHADLTERRDHVIQAESAPDDLIHETLYFARLFCEKGRSAEDLTKMLKSTEPFKQNFKILYSCLKKEGLL